MCDCAQQLSGCSHKIEDCGGGGGGTPTLNQVLNPTADKTFAMSGHILRFFGVTGDFANVSNLVFVRGESNDGSGDNGFTGLHSVAYIPAGGTVPMGQVSAAEFSAGAASDAAYISALELGALVTGGTVVDAAALNIANVTGATNNYAIRTGTGKVVLGDTLDVTGNLTAANFKPVLTGTSSPIGGGLLTVGQTAKGTAAVTGARTGMAVVVTPSTYPGDGTDWAGYVSSNDVVTVVVTAFVTVTPISSVYNVRAIQ